MSGAALSNDADTAARRGPAAPQQLDFLEGLPEHERIVGLLAQSLYRQNPAGFAGLGPDEAIDQARRKAEAELAAHAVRFLHNRIDEIKAEAIRERMLQVPPPPSFLRLVLAALVAFGIGAAAVIWITAQGILPTLLNAAQQARLPW